MMEMIGVGLYVFFEALSMIFCLHYLYGEKIYLDKFFAIYFSSKIHYLPRTISQEKEISHVHPNVCDAEA